MTPEEQKAKIIWAERNAMMADRNDLPRAAKKWRELAESYRNMESKGEYKAWNPYICKGNAKQPYPWEKF